MAIGKRIIVDRTEKHRIMLITFGFILNILFSYVGKRLGFPLYLDTVGTIMVAGECGMLSGIAVAVFTGLICGAFRKGAFYFALINIFISMAANYLFKKKVVRRPGGKLFFIVVIATIGGLFGTVSEWFLMQGTESSLFREFDNFISLKMEHTGFFAFFLAGIVFHFIDKTISVLLAFLIMFMIPEKIKEDIWEKDRGLTEGFSAYYDDDVNGTKRNRLRRALIWTLGIEATTLTLVIAWVSVSIYTEKAREERLNIARGTAQLVVNSVDAEAIDEYILEGYDAPGYRETEKLLYAIRDNTPYLEYVYVYRILENGYQIVFDLDSEEFPAGKPGDIDTLEDAVLPYLPNALQGKELPPFETNDMYGWLVTVYKPIYNSAGECVAYAGVDVSMGDLKSYIDNFLFRVALFSLAYLIFVLSLGMHLASNYHKIIDRQYKRIEKAKADADRANSAKTRFLANISHEIRTPINTIMGMDEMILREEPEDKDSGYAGKIRRYAANIRQASELLLNLINDILDVTKVESGKMSLVNQEYNTAEGICAIYSMIRVRSDEKGLTFTCCVDESIPTVLCGDIQKIKQVILNLLTNAVKYTKEGGFTLTIKVEERTASTCKIAFCVEDTGIGVKESDMGKLFSVFDRLEEDKNSEIQGTGLGLSLSKQFVELMGGDLQCESEYGKGSKFYFTIDQKIVDNTPIGKIELRNHEENIEVTERVFTAPEAKVLVVDDNQMNLQVICGLLQRTGLHLVTAESGRECLRLLGEEAFDVVLLDHMMPEMDGVETLAHIREKFPELPVIVLTANAANDGGSYYKSLGFTDYLSKPVDVLALENMLFRYLPDELIRAEKTAGEAYPSQEIAEEYEWLLDTEGISVEKGIQNCGGFDLFVKTLKIFYQAIEANSKELEEAFHKQDVEYFTIKVHALKSSARIIGADRLSGLCEALENAGKAKETDYINTHSEEMLELYRSYAMLLKPLDEKEQLSESDKPPVPSEELKEAYRVLREVVPQMDYDTVLFVLESMGAYQLPEEDAAFFEELEEALHKIDWEKIETMLE